MGMIGKNRRMAVLFLLAFRFVRLLLSGHQGVALENAALRMQIAAFQRKRKRPLLTTVDRVFWITLRSLWDNWPKPLLYVQPDTVVRWQRERFRKFWARLSKPQHLGCESRCSAAHSVTGRRHCRYRRSSHWGSTRPIRK